jgi:nitrite reductase (NO-forming)
MNFDRAQLSRRTMLAGVAFTTAMGAVVAGTHAALADDDATPAAEAAGDAPTDLAKLPRIKVDLVAPPNVHAHEQVATGGPAIYEFSMTVREKPMVIDQDGTTIQGMTYDGTVPGPMMVVHEGDYVELTLASDENNTLQHNIDLHAATGGGGGGALTLINPGEQVKLRFKATRIGAFLYHCAPGGEMIPYHVCSGMSGAIMVLPRDGLKDGQGKPLKYDRIYYVGEQDFYVPRDKDGKFKTYDNAGDQYVDAIEVMKGLVPTHVVFNGAAGALTGKNAMQANVGENVLIIHTTPNRDTRPHIIGGHGDYVWEDGKFENPPSLGLETWLVAGGSAAAALYKFRQPGVYSYVNHNLIEAIYLGATAQFKVEGKWDDDLMTLLQKPTPTAG